MAKEEEQYQSVYSPESPDGSSSKQHYRDLAFNLVNSAVQRGNNLAQQNLEAKELLPRAPLQHSWK